MAAQQKKWVKENKMYTIIGGNGFIGSNIAKRLEKNNLKVFIPEKSDRNIYGTNLGNVIYCAGLTSDYRERPYDTVEAHVSYLAEVIKNTNFDSFTYISSTRVYFNSIEGTEDTNLSINPNNLDDLFNISKLMGESICLNSMKKNIRIARISNVCGNDFSSNNFIYSIIKDAVEKQEIILRTTLDSEKDYIGIDEVVDVILKISQSGKEKIYNVASGKNISNKKIVDILKEITNCNVNIIADANKIKFPKINIDKIIDEFNFDPVKPEFRIKDLAYSYKMKER